MKRFLTKIFVVVIMLTSVLGLFTACDGRDNVLKIKNWGDYIDPDILDMFTEWYTEETGETVKIEYYSFDSNESIEREVNNKKDWDLICPSDYMIQKMRANGMLLEIDKSIVDITQDGLVDETLLELIYEFDEDAKYSVPYVWGTFGIMYNALMVDGSKADSWELMWDEEYSKGILMKDTYRDSYTVGSLYANREKLREYSKDFTDYSTPEYISLMESIFNECSEDSIETARVALQEQKQYLRKYEIDYGKFDMMSENAKLGLFWSCDAGYVMNDEDSGDVSKRLMYSVPKEGSNLWIDGWVIPKYAKNEKAANYFLKFLIENEEASILTAEYCGAPTINKSAMETYKEEISEDEEFFEGAVEGYKEMYLDMMFPSAEVLERCYVMKYFGDYNAKIFDMWISVKAS